MSPWHWSDQFKWEDNWDAPAPEDRDDPDDFFPSSKTFGFCLGFIITAFTLAVFAAQILKFLY